MEMSYDDCDLDASVPAPGDLPFPIRFICRVGTETTQQEGEAPDAWISTRSSQGYDLYGNVVEAIKHGIVGIGDGGCGDADRPAGSYGEPEGLDCLGDESYILTDYISPENTGGRWMLRKPYRVRRFAEPDGDLFTETRSYYDGNDFEGLANPELTLGLVQRVTTRTDDDHVIEQARFAYDAHGNVIESLSPRGDPNGPGFRTRNTYDAEALLQVAHEIELLDSDGNPYLLRRGFTYGPYWGKTILETNWAVVVDGVELDPPGETHFAYDNIGRLIASAEPGDDLAVPTHAYTHIYGSPVTQLIMEHRAEAGADSETQIIQCLDGFGRINQTRARVDSQAGTYEVTGFTVFNRRGQPVRVSLPHLSPSGQCDLGSPNVEVFTNRYDALGRPFETVRPDASLYETASLTRVLRSPLTEWIYDAEDTDPSSPHFDTPALVRFDGLGRVVERLQFRSSDGGSPPQRFRYTYDAYGNLQSVIDAEGNMRRQSFDAAGRMVQLDDPDRGTVTYAYDDASNLVRREDDTGRVTRWAHDAFERVVREWDEADEAGTVMQFHHDLAEGCPEGYCAWGATRLVGVSYPVEDAHGGD